MKITDCIGMSIIASVLVLMGCNGYTTDINQSRNSPGTLVALGEFSNPDCPYLFMSGQHRGLQDVLGSSLPKNFLATVEHTSDGRILRIWNGDRTKCYILESGRKPRIIDTPPGAYLNRDNQVVLTCINNRDAVFSNGLRMHLESIEVDPDGQYLCVGGTYYDSEAKARKEIPITFRSVDMPEKVLAVSRMKGGLWKSFCFKDKLYVFVRHYLPEEHGPDSIGCEVYHCQGDQLVLAQSMNIKSSLLLCNFVLVEDVCPDQAHLLLFAKRQPPLDSHRYLFDMKTQKAWDLGSANQYTAFIDRKLFDQLLDKADSQPSGKK